MFKALLSTTGLLLTTAFALTSQALAENLVFNHDNVLGSSLTISIDATRQEAQIAEREALTEIRRLESIFSSYRDDSELSLINAAKETIQQPVSAEMLEMVQLCQKWQQQLSMAFSCRLGRVKQAWRTAEQNQSRPDRKVIRALAREALYSDYPVDKLRKQLSPDAFDWDFGAIAKGYIIDRALLAVQNHAPSAQRIAIEIGGDTRLWQKNLTQSPWQLAIANPQLVDDSQQATLGQLSLPQGAVAYSGHSARTIKIGRRHYSHILKPRDGWPKDHNITAIVYAADATSADALATALATMEPADALDWVNKQADVEALLIDDMGRQYASTRWFQYYSAQTATSPTATIRFALPKIRSANYRKPYVAVWLEDSDHQVVKNLMLLGESERWMSKNSFWWRREGRKSPELLDIFARPTRRAGEYQITWQGRDDFGQTLAPGIYHLSMEAARENGDHERISIPFKLGQAGLLTASGQQEINRLELEIH